MEERKLAIAIGSTYNDVKIGRVVGFEQSALLTISNNLISGHFQISP